jgi:iron complex transport system ATP-binding protein
MTQTVLQARTLTIGYPQHGKVPAKVVSSDIDLDLHRGELVCLLGPNGAGKSTFLRTMAAMQRPLAGNVFFDGADIHGISPRDLARRLSVVLTERVNVGLMSTYGLVSIGRHPYTDWAGRLTPHDHAVVRKSIEAVGAEDLAHRPISELSDGERQKVMVARTLAQEPSVMVLDEITAFLDLPRRVEIMRLLGRLAHERGCAILLSSHDLELALRCADRIWLMPKGGDGASVRIYTGAPEDLVVDGAFEAVFAGEGITFDRAAGHFKLHEATIGDAILSGDGVIAAWTARALERLGYRVQRAGTGVVHVDVFEEGGRPVWITRQEGRIGRHGSIGEMVRSMSPGSRPVRTAS